MKRFQTVMVIALLLGVFVLMVGACGPSTPATTPAAKAGQGAAPAGGPEDKPLSPSVAVKMGTLFSLSGISMYTAVEKGFFKEQGINLDLIPFDTAAKMTAPLTTGELDVGGGPVSASFFNAIERGLPLKIVADWNSAAKPPSTLTFVVRKDLVDSGKVKGFPDWKGKNICINSTGIMSEIVLELALKKGGLTIKDVNVVIVPFAQVPIVMANKSADICLANEPQVTTGIDQGTFVRGEDVAELEPGRQISVVLYSPNFAKDKPDAAKRWLLAYLKGVRYYDKALQTKEGKAELIGILGKYVDVKDPTFYERVIFPTSNTNGYVNAKSIASDLDWYVAAGQVKTKVDLSTVIDNQFADYAVSKLGHYQ